MSDLGIRRTPYSIPDGTEPYPEDRLSWALEQGHHLGWAETVVLTFLARHAWGRDRASDYYPLGYVREEWASVRKIAEALGKSKSSVHRALTNLRLAGYVSMYRLSDPVVGNATTSVMKVWWYETDDAMREAVEQGQMALPEIFESTFDPQG